jgi:quercetin dioxygenase-like cupin family protein
MTQTQLITTASTRRPLNVIGDTITPLLTGRNTDGGFELFEVTGPEGSGPPPHQHPWAEAYVLLDGQLDVWLGGEHATLNSGDTAYVPGGTVHAYRIATPTARFVVVTSPAGAADFFADMDANVHAIPADMDRLLEVTARNHVAVQAPASV